MYVFLNNFESGHLSALINIENGNILFYAHYADDIFLLIDKNIEPKIFSEINNWDPNFSKLRPNIFPTMSFHF